MIQACEIETQQIAKGKDERAANNGDNEKPTNLLDILRQCLAPDRNEDQWNSFVRCTQPLITSTVTKKIRHWTKPTLALRDDLVQETYLKLCMNDFKALRTIECDHENAIFGFLKVVASNVVHDHFRSTYSQKRGSGRDDQDLEKISCRTGASARSMYFVERTVLVKEIKGCLENRIHDPAFSRDYAIFWLYYQHGLTAKAISRLPSIKLSVKGVESAVLRTTRWVRITLRGAAKADKCRNP